MRSESLAKMYVIAHAVAGMSKARRGNSDCNVVVYFHIRNKVIAKSNSRFTANISSTPTPKIV
jgi:hypothetical protein